GSGSSRDWAAKGTKLLGVRAVIAESYERIHRSNLVGMGVLPLQFPDGQSARSLGLTGEETFSIAGLAEAMAAGNTPEHVSVRAERAGADPVELEVRGWDARILVGQRVLLDTAGGPVPGVVGKKPIHLLRDEERKKVATIPELHIDIGARDGKQAAKMVRVGDVAVIDAAPVELP